MSHMPFRAWPTPREMPARCRDPSDPYERPTLQFLIQVVRYNPTKHNSQKLADFWMALPPNKRPKQRVLTRWNDDLDKSLLLMIQYVCAELGIKVPWDEVAKRMGSGFSPGAIIQHLAKLRKTMAEQGTHIVPPPLKKGIAAKAPSSVYRKKTAAIALPAPARSTLAEDVATMRGTASRQALLGPQSSPESHEDYQLCQSADMEFDAKESFLPDTIPLEGGERQGLNIVIHFMYDRLCILTQQSIHERVVPLPGAVHAAAFAVPASAYIVDDIVWPSKPTPLAGPLMQADLESRYMLTFGRAVWVPCNCWVRSFSYLEETVPEYYENQVSDTNYDERLRADINTYLKEMSEWDDYGYGYPDAVPEGSPRSNWAISRYREAFDISVEKAAGCPQRFP